MKTRKSQILNRGNQDGAVAVYAAIITLLFFMFTAMAVDVGHLYGVKNELSNAADAGALAGAHELFDDEGNLARDSALAEAARVTSLNHTGQELVKVGDVQTGHWSFLDKEFTPNENTTQAEWQERSFADLDGDPNFINAVRVVSDRGETPSFFAKVLGYDSFSVSAEAVAYMGFAGTLFPLEADQPIVICEDTLKVDDHYSCNIGRMINSGQDSTNNETGGWTDFSQSDEDTNVCAGGTNATDVRNTIQPGGTCEGSGNPESILLGIDIATNGGQISSAFSDLRECWLEASEDGTVPWEITLPVVTCPSNNIGTCEEVVGAVTVNVLLITGNGNDPGYNNVPTEMAGWDGDIDLNNGEVRWGQFIEAFNLKNVDGSPAPYQKKAIYFKPDCDVHIPRGDSGGQNFGILAKIPKIVQ